MASALPMSSAKHKKISHTVKSMACYLVKPK